jgi:hypothetical protein
MFSVSWPTTFETSVVDGIRNAIGRDVTFFVITSGAPCPVCDLDPITNTSTDSFCIICSGAYWIYTYSGVDIFSHITWGFSEQLGWVSGGTQDEGDCRIQIKYTPENIVTVETAQWVEVDGKVMQITKKILRGVQTLNRIILNLIEKER